MFNHISYGLNTPRTSTIRWKINYLVTETEYNRLNPSFPNSLNSYKNQNLPEILPVDIRKLIRKWRKNVSISTIYSRTPSSCFFISQSTMITTAFTDK